MVGLLAGAPRGAPALSPWQRIRFDKLIKEPALVTRDDRHYVMALEFSPDGSRVAVLVGQHREERQSLVHLLLVNLNGVERAPLETDLVAPVPMFLEKVQWSNDGKTLFVQFVDRVLIIDPNTAATTCESRSDLPRKLYSMPGGLIGPGSYVVGDRGDPLKQNGWLWFYDLGCRPFKEIEADAGPSSGDTAPAVGLLAMADENVRIVVVHPRRGRVLSIPDGRSQVRVAFLKSGRMLCSGKLPDSGDGSLLCWKLDSKIGGAFRRFEVDNGGTAPFAT